MKKLLSLLSFTLFITFIISGLYVFGLPPFQVGGPFFQASTQVKSETQQPLPDFLTQEKVSRSKTYDEFMKRGAVLEDSDFGSLAISEYQEANKLDPQNPDPFIKIGRIHLRNREAISARTNFENALRVSPNNIDATIYLGRSLLADRKIEEAREVFNRITADDQTAKYYQGIIAAYFGDYDKSKKLLTQAIEIGKSSDITRKAQNFKNALGEFDFNQGGQKTHLKTLLARSFDQTGEYQMAIAILFSVIKEQKDYRDAWILLGYAYLNLEKYQDSLEAFTEAKKLDPQKPETLFFLGLSYYGLNDLPHAVTALEQAKKNGFQPVIQVDQKLAEIYLQLKQYDKAAVGYESVVSLNDQDINYYIRPMWIYIEKLNQPSKALALAQKAFNNHPDQAMSYNLLAWAQIGNNQFVEAEKNLYEALRIDPQLDAVYLNLGVLNEKKGELDQAMAYYKKAHNLGHSNSIATSAAEKYNTLISKMKTPDFNTFKANLFNP